MQKCQTLVLFFVMYDSKQRVVKNNNNNKSIVVSVVYQVICYSGVYQWVLASSKCTK